RGATVNGQPLAVSPTAMLDESLLATGFPYNVRETADNNLGEYAAFAVRTRGVRRMGSAVVYLAWLATGRLDGYWELTLGPWDAAAGSLLVEEAGGRVTNLTGGALDLDAPALVASNGRIHDALLAWAPPSGARSRLTRRLLSMVFVVSLVGAGVWAYSSLHGRAGAPAYRVARVERGLLTSTVSATGALNAVITVQVGSQISGQIKQLLADFNSKVRRGDVLARIDPERSEAKVTTAQADVEPADATVHT